MLNEMGYGAGYMQTNTKALYGVVFYFVLVVDEYLKSPRLQISECSVMPV